MTSTDDIGKVIARMIALCGTLYKEGDLHMCELLSGFIKSLAAIQSSDIVTDGFIDIVMRNYHGHEMAGNREDMKAAITLALAAPESTHD